MAKKSDRARPFPVLTPKTSEERITDVFDKVRVDEGFAQSDVDKFVARISSSLDPLYELSWSSRTFSAAATVRIARHVLLIHKVLAARGCSLSFIAGKVHELALDQVLRCARNADCHSTSPTSNLEADVEAKTWEDMYKRFREFPVLEEELVHA